MLINKACHNVIKCVLLIIIRWITTVQIFIEENGVKVQEKRNRSNHFKERKAKLNFKSREMSKKYSGSLL